MSAGEFLDAAASYLGLDRDVVRKSEVFTDGADMVVAFELRLAPKDITAIAERMSKMVDEAQIAQACWGPARVEIPSYEDMLRGRIVSQDVYEQDCRVRERVNHIAEWGLQFDAMSGSLKAAHGSRFNYLLKRAREEDAIAAGVTSNADDFGGMPG